MLPAISVSEDKSVPHALRSSQLCNTNAFFFPSSPLNTSLPSVSVFNSLKSIHHFSKEGQLSNTTLSQ